MKTYGKLCTSQKFPTLNKITPHYIVYHKKHVNVGGVTSHGIIPLRRIRRRRENLFRTGTNLHVKACRNDRCRKENLFRRGTNSIFNLWLCGQLTSTNHETQSLLFQKWPPTNFSHVSRPAGTNFHFVRGRRGLC